jgi:amino acid adenylation domain-containing protein
MSPEKVDVDRPLLNLGLDSITAMELKVEFDAFLGTAMPLSMLIESAGIRSLAESASVLVAAPSARTSQTIEGPRPELPELRPSHEQQLLWYAHQFTPNRAAYHITGAAIIRAELHRDALRRALRQVIARQDALRTTFEVVDEKPTIHVHTASELLARESEWLFIEDAAGWNDREVKRTLTALASRPFDLEGGPLFRLHLLSRDEAEHIVLLVVDHIIADFWSTALLVDDLGKAYAAELAGQTTNLAPPRFQYTDFTRWQRAMVAGEEGERHWAYWQEQLSGPLPVLALPTDFARPPVRTYQGATRRYYLESVLTREIDALSDSLGISLYTALLAAFQVLLGRLSGQEDIVVGSPVAGRTRPGFEDVFGYFVNLVPMRSSLEGNPTFKEFVSQVRRTVALGLEHQDFPFSELVSRLQGSPDPSRSPIFQVMFAHQKAQRLDDQGLAPFALGSSGARLNLHGLTVESIELERDTALFDLTMMTAREGDRLCVALEYSTDLFTAASIDLMAAYFRTLLTGIVADAERRLVDIPLLSQPQRHQLLADWVETPAAPDGAAAVHHQFESQVERAPEAIALRWDGKSITYRELNQAANLLAHRLVALGVRPEVVVCLYLESWPSRLIGLLGVLKAGGAYLPLDPDHPAERIAAVLGDSGATILLTEQHLRARIPADSSNRIAVHTVEQSPAASDPGNPLIHVNPENLAYVIFTSGSTGRPKGVMVSHRSLAAAAAAWAQTYSLCFPPLRHLQAAGFSFDVFTGDWVRALTTGGTLVGCSRTVLLDPAELIALIRRERIECLELVPAVADALATHAEQSAEHLEDIRLFAIGSDTVRGRLCSRLRRLLGPSAQVINSYGLTETTIDSTYFVVAQDERDGDSSVPIGRAFAGTRTYVLDRRYEPVPPSVAGELYIGGCGLARGYVGGPRETAERFVPDPHGPPGSRIYATGDRATWRKGGLLELLGRQDLQVKVRGFRVELAEIEAALVRHPEVREAVVKVVLDSAGEKRLAAYVVPASALRPTATEMRRWLKDRLPEAMIPSWFVVLDALPLSRNGKVDRSGLQPPGDIVLDDSETDYVAPRTPVEATLAGITADLLTRDRVGIHENFFEIGVDSIIGIQIVSRARKAGLILDPSDLFNHPNVAELASAARRTSIDEASRGTSGIAIAPFSMAPDGIDVEAVARAFAGDGGIEDLYPLTPVQEGILFHTLAEPEAGHYVEQFVCHLRGALNVGALEKAWHRLIARHQALRASIHWSDCDQSFQLIHGTVGDPIDYRDWRGLSRSEHDERITDYLKSDRRRGFELSRPPLSRLAVFRLDADSHQLVWSIHHVVVDGWCLSILLNEMLEIYESIEQGQEPALEEIRPFRDYVAWRNCQSYANAQEYWRQYLKDFTVPTPIGISEQLHTCRQTPTEATAELTLTLSVAASAALEAMARAVRLTPSTLIQGAWAILLSRYSGRSDVLFGVTVSGRPSDLAGVESMVGMFINVLPLRVAVTEDSQLLTWLRDLQATMVELRRFEAIPGARIQGWSDVPAGVPLFESIVIVQNLPILASLQERAKSLGVESARFIERTHYPLAVTVVPGAELQIKICFDSSRFEPDAIERTLGHLCAVLEAMAASPEQRLFELPLLTAREHEQLLGRWQPSQNEGGLDDIGLEELTETELDSLMAELSSR